jgi:hypothetical protein
MPRGPSRDPLSPRLEELRDQLERWRSDPDRSKRIPEEIWSFAVDLTREVGAYRTARAGGLDFTTLKKRVAAAGAMAKPSKRTPKKSTTTKRKGTAFVELRPSSLDPSASCLIEIENTAGAKMRFHLGAADAVMLAALTRGFLRGEA